MYKATTSKIILVVILIFPIWDLVIQKGIKTYYQLFKMEPKIYAMPEFDKDGRVESLGLGDVTQKRFEDFESDRGFYGYQYNKFFTKISQFSELTISSLENKTKLIRVSYSTKSSKNYEVVDKQIARYQVVSTTPSIHFFGTYKKRYYRLIDTKQGNKVLAESFGIHFTDKYTFFRRNILWWQTGTGGNIVYVQGIDNLNSLIKKVFSLQISLNTNKGWK